MRAWIQAFSLLLFSVLFLLATYKLPDWLPAYLYLRLDPLLGLSAVFAAKEVIGRVLWALIVIGATLAIGRFFCAYVCPLGASIDFLDLLFFHKKTRPVLAQEAGLRKVKFILLIIFLSAALAGLALAFFLGPLALLTRFYTFLLYALVISLLNLVFDLLRPLARALGWITLTHLHYSQPVYYMTFITFLIFAGIIALNRFAPRFWCRYLCPLGAFLAFFSPLGFYKRRVSPECNGCRKCQQTCPMGALEQDPRKIRLAECIQCQTCSEVCPQEAITFSPFASSASATEHSGEYSAIDLSRRGFLYSLSGGFTTAFLAERTPFTPLTGNTK